MPTWIGLSMKSMTIKCPRLLYHDLFCRCPRVAIQPFLKALSDVQGIAFKPYLMQQLVDKWDEPLWSDIPEWNLKAREGHGHGPQPTATKNGSTRTIRTRGSHGQSSTRMESSFSFAALASLYHFLEAERLHRKTNGETGPPSGQMCVCYDNGCSNSVTVKRSPLRNRRRPGGWGGTRTVVLTIKRSGISHSSRKHLSSFIADKRLLSMLITLTNSKLMPTSVNFLLITISKGKRVGIPSQPRSHDPVLQVRGC